MREAPTHHSGITAARDKGRGCAHDSGSAARAETVRSALRHLGGPLEVS